MNLMKFRSRGAFTLMEVLVAAVVLAVGAVAAMETIARSATSGAGAARRVQALHLAGGLLARAAQHDITSFPAQGVETLGGTPYVWRIERGRQEGRLTWLVCRVDWGSQSQHQVTLERIAGTMEAFP